MVAFFNEIRTKKYLYILALPGILFLIIFAYTPLTSHILAFKDYNLAGGIFGSKWVGLENFKFFFGGHDWFRVTFNTVFLNMLFLTFGLGFALFLSIFLNEIRNKWLLKVTQSVVLLPYFISWLVVNIMVYTLLGTNGIANQLLSAFKLPAVGWYSSPQLWPIILTFINIWKFAGFNSIIFLAAITGISMEIYESAKIDGASKLQQMTYITLPLLRPTFIIMFLMGIGRIFYGDFGFIYGIIGDNGLLYPTTDVIDTYAYRSLRQMGNFSMTSAIILYQSAMGLCTICLFNWIVRKVEPDARLF